jgi:hypothetical protein
VRKPEAVETEFPVEEIVPEGVAASTTVAERDLEVVSDRGDDSDGNGAD